MSVLIKGMKMPHSCKGCLFCGHGSINEWELYCDITGSNVGKWDSKKWDNEWRSKDCPLVPVPTPHGWLIDAGALMREFAKFVRASNNSDFADVPTWNDAVSLVGSAPTIIEAEEGEV